MTLVDETPYSVMTHNVSNDINKSNWSNANFEGLDSKTVSIYLECKHTL